MSDNHESLIELGTLPTCEFLELRARNENEKRHLRALFYEFSAEDNTEEEKKEYKESIIGGNSVFNSRLLKAWCNKLDQCCIVTESVVINEATPLTIIVVNAAERIKDCPEAKVDSWREVAYVGQWILHYIERTLQQDAL